MFDHRAISRVWHERFSNSDTAPPHVRASMDQMDRHIETEQTRRATPEQSEQWTRVRDEVDAKLGRFKNRRLAEIEVAKYIESQVLPLSPQDAKLYLLPDAMRACRESGVYGCRQDGHHVVAWDAKCDVGVLCPHEAREETQRLAKRYLPKLCEHIGHGMRLYYAVFTMPNFQPGELKRGQKLIYKRFKSILKKKRPKKLGGGPLFPIRGAISVLEAPLAYDLTWNVHLNVIMVCDKYLNYEKLRKFWHWNVDIQDEQAMRRTTESRMLWKSQQSGNPMPPITRELVLEQAMLELIKYTIQTVSEKSGSGAGGHWQGNIYLDSQGRHKAPPLTQWPGGSFIEWWEAQQRFRRTRTYGRRVLFALDKPDAETQDKGAGLEDVTWLGRIQWMRDGRYRVAAPLIDLILGHNSTPEREKAEEKPPPEDAHEALMGKVQRISATLGQNGLKIVET